MDGSGHQHQQASNDFSRRKRVAIVQSCYVPWKGFFDLMGRCDEYVIFDRVQYVKRHWHNRNKIKTPKGAEWITIPVISKSRYEQPIDEVEISEPWAEKHWRSVELNYKKAPFFGTEGPRVRAWYEAADGMRRLTDINRHFISALARDLRLTTRIVSDQDYPAGDLRQTERLVNICKQAGATHYISGPSAQAYLEEEKFAAVGITVEWMSYGPYPSYPQLHGLFEHQVSVLDVIFQLGREAQTAIRPVVETTV
jgi:WbqC-like protein family